MMDHKIEIIDQCHSICCNELLLFNDVQLERFYNLNKVWLEKHYPFSDSDLYVLGAKLRFQMPRLFQERRDGVVLPGWI